MAPLVDCMMLLLIFFLFTSSFLERRGIRIELPRSSTARDTEQKAYEIMVSNAGEITFAGQTMGVRDLAKTLPITVAEQGKKPVFMLADRLVPLEKVTEVIDCIRAAKLETVSIATKRKEGSSGEQHE